MNQFTLSMVASIGACEAKAQLARLLRAEKQGERFTITVRVASENCDRCLHDPGLAVRAAAGH